MKIQFKENEYSNIISHQRIHKISKLMTQTVEINGSIFTLNFHTPIMFFINYCSPNMLINPENESFYTYSLNQMKSIFKHNFRIDKNSSDTKTFLNLKEMDQKFRICTLEFSGKPLVALQEDDPIGYDIRRSLNRLTQDRITEVTNSIKSINGFGTTTFFDKFIRIMFDCSSKQLKFNILYAQVIGYVHSSLKSQEQKDAFSQRLMSLTFANPLPTQDTCYFIGCLLSQKLIPFERYIDFARHLLEDRSENAIEGLIKCLIPCINLNNSNCKPFSDIVNRFKLLIDDKSLNKRIHFKIIDFFEFLEKSTSSITEFVPSISPKIPKSSEENENPDKIIIDFIQGNNISTWNCEMTESVINSLCTTTNSNFLKGIAIFDELWKKKFIPKYSCINTIKNAQKYFSNPDQLIDFPAALTRLGMIFCHLVIIGNAHFKSFGKNIQYNVKFFKGILEEIVRTQEFDKLTSCKWMTDLRFLPKSFGFLELINAINETEMYEVWPAFDQVIYTFDAMNSDISLDQLKKELNEAEIADKITMNSKELAECFAETIVICKPELYSQTLIEYPKKFPYESLMAIERVGVYYKWTNMEIAKEINGLAHAMLYPIKTFKESKGNSIHKKIAKLLPNL